MSEKYKLLQESTSSVNKKYGSVNYKLLNSAPNTYFTKSQCIWISLLLLIAAALFITSLIIGLPRLETVRSNYFKGAFPVSDMQVISYQNNAVVSDGEPCASIGKSILELNGSAVDAAIAMTFCDEVANPQSSGIGGGFLMTIYIKEQNLTEVIDARETAPINVNASQFENDNQLAYKGGLSVAIPGQLKGLWTAHRKYGKLSWRTLIEPTVKLCRDGIIVNKYLENVLITDQTNILNSNLSKIFVNNETGNLLKAGDRLQRPDLGDFLENIANNGIDDFYNGSIALDLVDEINKNGGIWTIDDLRNYEVKSRNPLNITIHNQYHMLTVPPPGTGSVIAFILNVLDEFDISCDSQKSIQDKILHYHRIVETFKFALAHKAKLGDPDFNHVSNTVKNTINSLVNNLTSHEYARTIASKIGDFSHPASYYDATVAQVNDQGTSQVNVISSNGDAVSVTSTINSLFGSRIVSESTGIIFNNEMADFDLQPTSQLNKIEPGKRPLSSMAPTIIIDENRDAKIVIGGIGGTRITTAMALVLHRILWECKSLKEATDESRLYYEFATNELLYEANFPKVYLDGLFRFGHNSATDYQLSSVYTILRNNSELSTAADSRKGGSSDGY